MKGSTSCSPFRCQAAAYRVSLLLILALSQKKGGKERKKKRQGLTFLTLVNSFNWKMSIITKFPGIRGSVVYTFLYEIDHYFFCHIEFVSIWWLSCWERHAYLLVRSFFIAPYFEAPATQLRVVVFKLPPKGTRVRIRKQHMEIKWKVRTYLFCSCTKIKSAGIWWTFGQWGGAIADFCAPIHSRVVKHKRINVCGQTIQV